MSEEIHDVLILGGGPAGVTAALRARDLGATVALIERGRLGGTCTNDGCVPTRVLAKSARLVREAEQFGQYGLTGALPVVHLDRVMARARSVVNSVHAKKRMKAHLEETGVVVRDEAGPARFVNANTVALPDASRWAGRSVLLCVGGHARRPAIPGGELALTHSDLWSLTRLPQSLLVVGAAATGCQITSVMAAFGSKVTLADAAPRLVPAEDGDVSAAIAKAFKDRGIELMLGCGLLECIEETSSGGRSVRFASSDGSWSQEYAMVILAAGWPGNLDGLSLENAGVETHGGYVVVNDRLQTSAPQIYAAGDITGRMMLVQSAADEARVAVENAVLGSERELRHFIVPHGGFTDPEYASVGLTEAAAREREECAVALVPYAHLDRALIDGRREGFCKLIVSCSSRKIVGAHVVGEQALEVVQVIAATMAADARVETLAKLEIAYPTFTGIVGLSARRILQYLGLDPLSPDRRHSASEVNEWERSG